MTPLVETPLRSPHCPSIGRVEARGLTKLFGPTPALRGAHLSLRRGEVTLLVGPNGAGKSTLLNIVGTQLKPTRGTIEYLDEEGRALERSQVRSQLGWVSHASHCYAELTGRQNVELAARLHGLPNNAYAAIADEVGLGKFVDRPLSTLSRGQTQRVALARALVHAPELLLLDEPWTGLDHSSAKMLEELVLRKCESGCIILIVSHEPGLAQRLSARLVEVLAGRCDGSLRDEESVTRG